VLQKRARFTLIVSMLSALPFFFSLTLMFVHARMCVCTACLSRLLFSCFMCAGLSTSKAHTSIHHHGCPFRGANTCMYTVLYFSDAQVLTLMGTDLVRHKDRWAFGVKEMRDIFVRLENEGYSRETQQVWMGFEK